MVIRDGSAGFNAFAPLLFEGLGNLRLVTGVAGGAVNAGADPAGRLRSVSSSPAGPRRSAPRGAARSDYICEHLRLGLRRLPLESASVRCICEDVQIVLFWPRIAW
jgi:hypothetical protein